MAGLFEYLMRKATGKRTGDIELPNESGEVDPRLPKSGQVGESFRKAGRTVKDLSEVGGSPIERLQAAGKRGMRKRFDEENRRALEGK